MSRRASQTAKPKIRKLRPPVQRHLGTDITRVHTVSHDLKPVERVNIQRVLDRWTAGHDADARSFGFTTTGYFPDDGLVKYLITDELIEAPVERAQLATGPDDTLDCVSRGLVLFRREGVPLVVGFRPARYSSDLPVLEVVAPTREAARDALTALLREAQLDSVYKGKTLTVEAGDYRSEGVRIRFQPIRPVRRDDIVLPEELLAVVERNVFGMLRHADALRAAGRSLRRGLLFHGPPGTGKTLLVRYLTLACENHTAILLTGAQQGLVREACQIARLLAPSIVVLEDVDLVAENREQNRCSALLHDLLNEMDGLGPRDEVTFMLTTNRPEVLEPALSARPGRVDQAVAFPLPDEAGRRRLFEVYGRGLDLSAVDATRWVSQTAGVSPAFIEELLRKAALLAAERGEESSPMRLTDGDIHDALRELVHFGGELTQRLLGYRPGRIGYGA